MATATSSILLHPSISATKTILPVVSSISISRPRKPNNRKNYLRPKILKTIPFPDQHPILPLPPLQQDSNLPSIDQFPIDSPTTFTDVEEVKELKSQEVDQFPIDSSTTYTDVEEVNELKSQGVDQFEASESSAAVEIASGKVGKFPENSFLKFGLWLVGAFILQTICAIWLFNSDDNKGKYQTLENEDENNNSRINNSVNGNVNNIDEQTQKKIEEIRIMARVARDSERLEREKNGFDGNESDFEDEGEEGFGKSGIEKEVNERLSKLKEKLEKNRDKISKRLHDLKGDGVMGGEEKKNGVEVKAGNEDLVFKRRYKFKGALGNQRDIPKGFSVPSEKDISKVEESRFNSENEVLRSGSDLGDGSNMLDGDQRLKLEISDGNGKINVSKDTEKRQGRNIDVAEHKFPKVQDRNNGSPVAVTANSRDPNVTKAKKVTKHQNRRGSSNSLKSGSLNKPCSGSEWWEKLPYVLVILMEKSRDGDKVRGLYTLKSSSDAEGELSHIVAFQDRGDATNFCYLLQLYFEDLGDVSIDVVPMSIKELKEATESKTKRVIVAKKGQLQLFAGQPISDVEVALRSLMEQD